jgi:anti-sigma factor RsiW
MKIDSDIIQRLLDGEVPEGDRAEVLRGIEADPELRREYEDLRAAMILLERDGPAEAPPGFTSTVMRRIPLREPSFGERVRVFLFGSRELRWNMASAIAGSLVILFVLVALQLRDSVRSTAPTAEDAGTVTVRLSFYAPQARQVAVAGDFNRWTVGTDLMERRNGGVWTVDLTLRPGRYSYMFVLDGETWVTDPGAEGYQDDGFGSRNAVLQVRT